MPYVAIFSAKRLRPTRICSRDGLFIADQSLLRQNIRRRIAYSLLQSVRTGTHNCLHCSSRTNQDIPLAIIEELSAHENMIGVKECMGHERIRHYEKQGIMCWTGNDDQSHDSKHIDNAHGVISVTSNLLPCNNEKTDGFS